MRTRHRLAISDAMVTRSPFGLSMFPAAAVVAPLTNTFCGWILLEERNHFVKTPGLPG